MKTIFKSALMVCLALTVGLAGCSKEQYGTEESNGEKTVTIQISQGLTRAPGVHQVKETIAVNDAAIYFTSSNGNVIQKVDVDFSETPATGAVTMATLKEGHAFTNLPGSITGVYVAANSTIGYAHTNISAFDVHNAVLLTSQSNVDDVALFGGNTLGTPTTAATATTNAKYSVTVNITPVVARLEIGEIASGDFGGLESTIKDFTLEGIYIDNYYPKTNFKAQADTLVPGRVEPAFYGGAGVVVGEETLLHVGPSDVATAAFTKTPATTPAIGATYTPTYTITAGQERVWAYNLIAGPAPVVVIKVSGVTVVDKNDATKTDKELGVTTCDRIVPYISNTRTCTHKSLHAFGKGVGIAEYVDPIDTEPGHGIPQFENYWTSDADPDNANNSYAFRIDGPVTPGGATSIPRTTEARYRTMFYVP